MKSAFKLYWVETPSPEENCFVAARSKRAAAKYEDEGTGFDQGGCKARLVRGLDSDWVARYRKDDESNDDRAGPFYVQPEDVHELGVEWKIIEGEDVFFYGEEEYVKQGDMNYIASFGDDPKNIVIRSVADLLEVIQRDAPGAWIFRGHVSCRWKLESSVRRLASEFGADDDTQVRYERGLLNEFKRKARIFLQARPSSDWEWMVLAQHFGLPTRMLDWTENPLVALYFAVREDTKQDDDGILYAYRHGTEEVDIESTVDPFTIKRIELVRPPHLDQRVIAQQSVFTAEPPNGIAREKSDLRYWQVSVHFKSEIKRELAKLGISENALFPGLSSLATEIKDDLSLRSILRAQRRISEA